MFFNFTLPRDKYRTNSTGGGKSPKLSKYVTCELFFLYATQCVPGPDELSKLIIAASLRCGPRSGKESLIYTPLKYGIFIFLAYFIKSILDSGLWGRDTISFLIYSYCSKIILVLHGMVSDIIHFLWSPVVRLHQFFHYLPFLRFLRLE